MAEILLQLVVRNTLISWSNSGVQLAIRYVGFLFSWFLYAAAFTGLFLGMRAILAVGGFCAEGGPFEIQTECPDQTGWMFPLFLPTLFVACAVYYYLAKGLGASLLLMAWPILFIGLSWNFFESGIPLGVDGLVWTFLGVMFFVMGAAPVFGWLKKPATFSVAIAGRCHTNGIEVAKVGKTYLGGLEYLGEDRLTASDYLILIPLWLLATGLGVWLAFTLLF